MPMVENSKSQLLKKAVYVVLLNLIFILTVYIAYQSLDFENFNFLWDEISIPWFISSIVAFILFYILQSVAWYSVLGMYSEKKQYILSTTFLASQVFKYLPSSIFSFSFRFIFVKRFGIGAKAVTKAILLENGFQIYTGLIFFCLFFGVYRPVFLLLVPLLLCMIYVSFYLAKHDKSYIKKIPVVGKMCNFTFFSYTRIHLILLLYLSSWLLSGLSIYLFRYSVTGQSDNFFNISAAQALSYSASILAVFSPGGIGVKELVLQIGRISDNLILNWRVITVLIDIFVSAIAIGLIYGVSTKTKIVSISPKHNGTAKKALEE